MPEAGRCFVFSGNGSQWPGMGLAAYRANRAFRESFDAVDALFARRAGWSLADALAAPGLGASLGRTEIAQPLLFAVQVALVEALAASGCRPAAVIGHSIGEAAAAFCAGALDRADAVAVIHARSSALEPLIGLGAMAALLMSEADARAAIATCGLDGIEIAAINSPRGVTLSGPVATLDAFVAVARGKRWVLKRLDFDCAFHTALVDPLQPTLMRALAPIRPRAARATLISTVEPGPIAGSRLDADYWWRNLRRPVRFQAAIEAAAALGYRRFVEIGPRPMLGSYITDTLAALGVDAAVAGSLDRHDDDSADPVARIVADISAATTGPTAPSPPAR